MLHGEKILVTGVTGKIAFPIARALAKQNEVWGAARLPKPGDCEKLSAAGIKPVQFDMATGNVSTLPADFGYVFHAAVDPAGIHGDWPSFVRTNAPAHGNRSTERAAKRFRQLPLFQGGR
jgi:nucleoside-diphosphate-sugar epimerase